ncbi:MAG: hypothetical protein NTU77_12585, partial [Actinobacteria bacterium]|nr:hypothetical protein [Actinomycetota bacterium]
MATNLPPESELEILTYEDFGVGIRWLSQQLVDEGWIPDAVLGVVRGGLFVAAGIAYALDLKDVRHVNVEFYTDVGETLPEPVLVGDASGPTRSARPGPDRAPTAPRHRLPLRYLHRSPTRQIRARKRPRTRPPLPTAHRGFGRVDVAPAGVLAVRDDIHPPKRGAVGWLGVSLRYPQSLNSVDNWLRLAQPPCTVGPVSHPGRLRDTMAVVARIAMGGPVSTVQLRGAGLTVGQIRAAVHGGELLALRRDIVVASGIWSYASADGRVLLAARAALLVHPNGAVSHETAARLIGLPTQRKDPALDVQ